MIRIIRWLLVASCIGLAMWVSASIGEAFQSTPDQISLVPPGKHAAELLDFARQNTERLFQIVVLLLGGLWALAIVDKEHQIRDAPEIIMFVITNLIFVAFLYFFQHYNTIVEDLYWDIGIRQGREVDFLHSPYINLYRSALLTCFYVGLSVTAITTFSLCFLRRR